MGAVITKMVTVLLMAAFYSCYFIKMINQRKKGIRTDQLGKGKEGLVKFIGTALKITTCALPLVQLISIVYCKANRYVLFRRAGVAITAAGVAVFMLSVLQMKDNWRAGVQKEEKTMLVTTGIYSISRNPAFLGFDLMYTGILFTYFNWCLCAATVIAVLLFHLQIVKAEENFLTEAFGNEYRQYKSKVCRYFGRRN